MSSSKLVCFKLFIPLALSLVIPEVLCLSVWSPSHRQVGERGKEYSTFIYILGHLNAFLWSLRIC